MSIELGVMMDPIGSINIRKDSTFAMTLAARRRGWLPLAVFCLAILTACGQDVPVTTMRFRAIDAIVDLTLVGVSREQAQQAARLIQRDLDQLEQELHPWKPGPLALANQQLATGESFVAPPSVMPLVRLGKIYETQSGGLFSPALGHLLALWGFHTDPLSGHPPPSARQIASLVETNPGMAGIDLNGLELRGRQPAIRLDFSLIVRGYALDLAVEYLHDLGVRGALVQIGGDQRAIGDRRGQPWRISVRRASGSGVLGIVPLRDGESLVTLADYDRNFLHGGAVYHDILDPRTGWPTRDTHAVTVLHTDATTARAAAAALFVAGPAHWYDVARKMSVRYVLLTDSAQVVHLSPELAERIELVGDPPEIRVSAPLTPAPVPHDG